MSILKIDLGKLDRGSLKAGGMVKPAELALSDELRFNICGPMELDVRVSTTDSSTFYIHGEVSFKVAGECRRCLEKVVDGKKIELRAIYAYPDALAKLEIDEEKQEEEGVFALDYSEKEIDLSKLVRETIILEYPRFLECPGECVGLCDACGQNIGEVKCDCGGNTIDPRWAKLKELESKLNEDNN